MRFCLDGRRYSVLCFARWNGKHALPNAYFAIKAFRYSGARQMPLVIKVFLRWRKRENDYYSGDVCVEFLLEVEPLNELAVIISYILVLITGLIATAEL